MSEYKGHLLKSNNNNNKNNDNNNQINQRFFFKCSTHDKAYHRAYGNYIHMFWIRMAKERNLIIIQLSDP